MNSTDNKKAERAGADAELLCDGIRIAEIGPDGRYVAAACGATGTHGPHWLDGRDYFDIPIDVAEMATGSSASGESRGGES